MCVGTCVSQLVKEGQRTVQGNQLSPNTVWVPEIELELSDWQQLSGSH